MIEIKVTEADYFDDCEVCGACVDHARMFELEIGDITKVKLCRGCFEELIAKAMIVKIQLPN